MNAVVRTIISLLIVAGGVGAFFWLGEPEVYKRPPEAPIAPAVKLVSAEEHDGGIPFVVDGVVVPYRQIQLAAQVSGRVDFKSDACRVGRAVKKGDVLVRIEKRDYELEIKRLTEEVKQAEASLAELDAELKTTANQIASARLQLDIEKRNVQRSNDLVARRITSAAEVDDARKAELNSMNSLQTLIDQQNLQTTRRMRLESQKILGEANLDRAELSLERTEILSPIDGVVVSENVEQDGFVQTGSPVITLQDTSQLDVTCKLQMKQMHWLWQSGGGSSGDLSQAYAFPETPATILYNLGGSTFEWKGVVNRYDGAGVDNQTRMVPCRVNVADPLGVSSKEEGTETYESPPTLMTGMFVKVRIDAKPPIPLVRIPQKAVQPGSTVWVSENGKLKEKSVSVATTMGDSLIAYQEVGGLQAGDQVIVTPLATPVEGHDVVDIDNLPDDYVMPGSGGGWGGPPGAGGPPGGKPGGGKPSGGRPGGGKPAGGPPSGKKSANNAPQMRMLFSDSSRYGTAVMSRCAAGRA